ncbi:initiation factor 2 [Gigaspora margarita]|uniref:Initiation factor 2 n=1 Tax=Gigaspora margarita TaxID=4874 RepID=A0A8H3XBP4_GIGMA|nr:initiation factor 2 [Gigaspora margarita]
MVLPVESSPDSWESEETGFMNFKEEDSTERTRQKFRSRKDNDAFSLEPQKQKVSRQKFKSNEVNDSEEFEGSIEPERPKKVQQISEVIKKIQRDVFIPEAITVSNLAKIICVRLAPFERKLRSLGIEYTTHDHLLNSEEASLIAMEYDLNPIVDSIAAIDLFPKAMPKDMSIYPLRPPIVTIMGHVDHGKTTLLDALRKTSVAAGEVGGITQHIGAFSVSLPSQKTITFLDTPGHAAFSAMRARGAHVTDIVVLVVAADDGVMPQTLEAIKHAKDAGVPIIVAINKIDKHDANSRKVRDSLMRHGIELEEVGGDTQCVEISALTGKGLGELEEAIITLAELNDYRAEVDIEAEGVIIESQIEKGKGNVATVLVKRGTLKQGDIIVAGTSWCKVRIMSDDKGQSLKQAPPGTPVKVVGWRETPNTGDEVLQATDEVIVGA